MRKISFVLFLGLALTACGDDTEPTTECTTRDDCGAGEVCEAQVCVPDEGTTPECTTSDDCGDGEVCEAGACVTDGDGVAECAPVGAPENGSVDQPEPAQTGAVATFSCEEGYVLDGSTSLTCGADGAWDGEAPVCNACDAYSANGFETRELISEDPEEYAMIGFNLDGVVTVATTSDPPSPENGCNQMDSPGGVDNTLGLVLQLLASLDIDVTGALDSLVGDSLLVETRVQTGAEGSTMTIVVDDEVVLENLPATENGDGTLEASAESFSILAEQVEVGEVTGGDGVTRHAYVDVLLTLNDVRFRLDPATGALTIGGVLVYGDETTGPETFRPNIVALVAALTEIGYDIPVDQNGIDAIFAGAADMALDGENCVDLSIGMRLPGTVGVCE